MEIKIEPQMPDGCNVTISDLIFDTDEQVFEFLRLCRKIKEAQQITARDIAKIKL